MRNQNQNQIPWYIINPDSLVYGIKEQIWIYLIFFIAFYIPITICFDDAVASNPTEFFIVSVLVDIFFIIDLILNFFVEYREKSGVQIIIDLELISKRFFILLCLFYFIMNRYIKGWFVFDLLTSFPMSIFILQDPKLGVLRILRIARLPKIFKIMRVAKYDLLKNIESFENCN